MYVATQTILDEIVAWKREEVARAKSERPLELVREQAAQASPVRDFEAAMRARGVSLVAEVKRASPSKGLLRPDLDPASLAREYESSGASAISVLTDERFFQGHLDHLRDVRQSAELPVLRKDFLLESYQVFEARAAGADAVLLITAALEQGELEDMLRIATDLGMAALVEAHDEREMERALSAGPRIIGVNNRDLRTFVVDLATTERLRSMVPEDVLLIAESGIRTRADVERMVAVGVDAVLVGEALLRSADVGAKVRELVG
ncbi:MAG: indole-3-glycerol phosphate synthase TrpC [Anaerolineales bacterium]|nr:MAG: indole-3-glycerol phosphate synthase TrpC [Anaerolineales bacterium]